MGTRDRETAVCPSDRVPRSAAPEQLSIDVPVLAPEKWQKSTRGDGADQISGRPGKRTGLHLGTRFRNFERFFLKLPFKPSSQQP
jgi:hypothetical protein